MLEVSYTGRSKRDYRLCIKQGCDMRLLQKIVDILAIPAVLPEKNKDYEFKERLYRKERMSHLARLLAYKIEDERLVLYRTGNIRICLIENNACLKGF